MLTDWIRNNALTAIVAASVATAGTVAINIYVHPSPGPIESQAPKPVPFPKRFVLEYSGKVGLEDGPGLDYKPIQGYRRTICDLTVEADGNCSLEIAQYGIFRHHAVLTPHAGDATMVSLRIKEPGPKKEPLSGLTWAQLSQGISYGNGTFQVKALGGGQ